MFAYPSVPPFTCVYSYVTISFMGANVPVSERTIHTSQDLSEYIKFCRANISKKDNGFADKALNAFKNFAGRAGSQLANSQDLPDMIVTLVFLEHVEEVNKVIAQLANDHGEALANNPYMGIVIELLCRFNQEVEALQILAQITKAHPETVKENPSLRRALHALFRKDADIETHALAEWLNSDHDLDSFPTFPRIENILAYRNEVGMTIAPIQRSLGEIP